MSFKSIWGQIGTTSSGCWIVELLLLCLLMFMDVQVASLILKDSKQARLKIPNLLLTWPTRLICEQLWGSSLHSILVWAHLPWCTGAGGAVGALAQGLVSLAGRGGGSVGGLTATATAATAAVALTGGAGKAGAEPFTTAAETRIKPQI